jgi:hypothetical protein
MNKLFFLALVALESLTVRAETRELVYFTKGTLSTIILPFPPDEGNGHYYRLDRCENRQIIFEEELFPKAHIPYIIVPTKDFSVNLDDMELYNCRRDTTAIDGVFFVGTYTGGEYVYKDSFYYCIFDSDIGCYNNQEQGIISLSPLHAFLEIDWRVNHGTLSEKMEIRINDEITSIRNIYSQNINNESYDLQGHRLQGEPQKGIYVKGGRKFLRK